MCWLVAFACVARVAGVSEVSAMEIYNNLQHVTRVAFAASQTLHLNLDRLEGDPWAAGARATLEEQWQAITEAVLDLKLYADTQQDTLLVVGPRRFAINVIGSALSRWTISLRKVSLNCARVCHLSTTRSS